MKKTTSGVEEGNGGGSSSQRIDARIEELGDWRGEVLVRLGGLIKQAAPEVAGKLRWECMGWLRQLSLEPGWFDLIVVFGPERRYVNLGRSPGFAVPDGAAL